MFYGQDPSKAFISFRIGISQWIPENRFRELLDLFEKYKGVTDEVTFVTSDTHAPLPLNVIKEQVDLLAKRMLQVRKKSYRTGINILATIGHHNENLPNSLSADFTPLTDINGNVCLGSFCPNDEGMRGYIEKLYKITVSADPDYIWIDDDVRLFGHLPIICGCFCDNCLSIFEKEFKGRHTRESLKAVFNNGHIEKKLELRRAWLQHNGHTISRLFELIEKIVHGLKPDLPLGFMTGDRFFESYDFDRWAEILSGHGQAKVMWRPGGGFYTDDCLRELAGKSHAIGRQVSVLPDSVISIQSEIENFTYERLKKSAHVTALEAASHLAAGCTGAAFNVLSPYDESLDEYEPLVAKLTETRPFYDLMVQLLGRSKPVGVYSGWGKDIFVTNNITEGDWFGGNIWEIADAHAIEILELGIPAAYSLANALVTLLSKDSVLAMKDEDILKILSSGVYMDAQALIRLNQMGYSEVTGFDVDGFVNEDCIEEFVNHPLNAAFAGRKRDGRQSFWWKCPAGPLRTLDEKAEILARMVNYGGREMASCCLGVFENRLGGRICVAGYYSWMFLQNFSKSSQIKSIMRWLSKDTMPAYVASFHKINMWVREGERGRQAVVITNASHDRADNLTLMLRTEQLKVTIYDRYCKKTIIHSCGKDDLYKKFILPPVDSWDMRLVIA